MGKLTPLSSSFALSLNDFGCNNRLGLVLTELLGLNKLKLPILGVKWRSLGVQRLTAIPNDPWLKIYWSHWQTKLTDRRSILVVRLSASESGFWASIDRPRPCLMDWLTVCGSDSGSNLGNSSGLLLEGLKMVNHRPPRRTMGHLQSVGGARWWHLKHLKYVFW